MLFSVPLPLSNPVTSIRKNIGTMTNKGVELQLGGDVIRKKDYSWNILTNSSIIKNIYFCKVASNEIKPNKILEEM